MIDSDLDFEPEGRKVNELKDYARRHKLTGYSYLRKQKLIELVNKDMKEKAKSLLSKLQIAIFLEIVNLYCKGKDYEYIVGVNSDFLADRINMEEKTIMEVLKPLEKKDFLIGEAETYWRTPFNRETGQFGKRETIHTHKWKITEKGKKLANAILSPKKIKW